MDNIESGRTQFDDLCEALRLKIKAFKKQNPNLSGLQIAKIFGMASSTLNRIENRSIRTPSLDQVVKVLRGVGAHDELIRFMDEFYPSISDTFRKHISYGDNQILKQDDLRVILEPEYFKVFILAVCGDGVSVEYLKNHFGHSGCRKVEFLVSKKILKLDGNRYKQDENSQLRIGKYAIKKFVTTLIDQCYKPNSDEGYSSGFSTISTCSIKSEETIIQVKAILKEARDRIRLLVDSDEGKGDIKYFVTMCCDTI